MTDEVFREVFAWIERFHGKQGKLDQVVREEWQRKFQGEDDDVFCAAANLLISRSEPERFFPAIATMEKAILDVKDARRRAEKAESPGVNDLLNGNRRAPRERTPFMENLSKLFDGLGRMPKPEWLKLGLESGVFTPGEVEKLKESWRAMGVGETQWGRKPWL